MSLLQAIIAGQKDSKLHTASREDMPHLPKNQRAWLTDQCKKLVAENRGVRNVELEEYKDKNKVNLQLLILFDTIFVFLYSYHAECILYHDHDLIIYQSTNIASALQYISRR